MTEDQGFTLLMEVIQLARAGKPYRVELIELKRHADQFPKVAAMLRSIVQTLDTA